MSGQVEPMELEDFRRLLDVHGADEARWPMEQRVVARALLARDARARALLEEALALEALLADSGAPPADEGLEWRILQAAGVDDVVSDKSMPDKPVPDRPAAANDNAPTPWWLAAPLAASLLLGVGLGFSGVLQPVQQALLAQAEDPLLEAMMPVEDGEGELL